LKTVLLAVLLLALAAAAAAVAWSYWRFSRSIDRDVVRIVAAAPQQPATVTAERLAGLPAVVQRYLAWSGVVAGQAIPSVVRLTQVGRIRSGRTAAWMAFEAEETYSTAPPAFVWRAWLPRRSLPLVIGRDLYTGATAGILMKALGLFAVADEGGEALRAAGLMRYLSEMIWFPAAFLGDNVSWRGIDEQSAEVTISDRGMTATAVLFFDGEGRLTNFRAERYNTGTRSVETWETPITGYGAFAGLTVPVTGVGVWKVADGDFTYIELEVTGVTYEPEH